MPTILAVNMDGSLIITIIVESYNCFCENVSTIKQGFLYISLAYARSMDINTPLPFRIWNVGPGDIPLYPIR
jgi:hypothetical protein